jgi:hypothetical protein
MNMSAGNGLAILGFAALGIAALVGGFFVIRAQVRQVMKTEGRPMPRL